MRKKFAVWVLRVVLFALACLAVYVLVWSVRFWMGMTGGSFSSPDGEAVVEVLSTRPETIDELRSRLAASVQNITNVDYAFNSPRATEAETAQAIVRGKERSPKLEPVWRRGFTQNDVTTVYGLTVFGGGGGMGGGDPRAHFEFYGSDNGALIGWYCNDRAWRSRIAEHWR